MTGEQMETMAEELNGGAAIGETLLFQLINMFRAIVEQMRPWMVLRKTDTSKSVTTSNTWQTTIDLSTITDFNRFHGEYPIRLFDGTNRIEYYKQVPFRERLFFKDASNTFCYDESSKTLYLNGTLAFAGTLWIHYIKEGTALTSVSSASAWPFPSWSHAILPLLATASHKGGVDYDEINAQQLVTNNTDAARILAALEKWDNEKQLNEIEQYDPIHSHNGGFRPNAVPIDL